MKYSMSFDCVDLSIIESDAFDSYTKHRSECHICVKVGNLCDIGEYLRHKWNVALDDLSKES